jgi:hypothetical protein
MPEASSLALIRREIDRKPSKLKRILRDAGIRREFLDGVSDDEREVVKEFVDGSSVNALKTKPKVGPSLFLASLTLCISQLPSLGLFPANRSSCQLLWRTPPCHSPR